MRKHTGSYGLMVWLIALALASLAGCTGTIEIGIMPTPTPLETQPAPAGTQAAEATSPPTATEAATVAPEMTSETPTPTPDLTAMPPADATLVPATATPIPASSTPTVTPLPPAPTPAPAPAVERILFAPGATQTTVEGYLPAGVSRLYVMGVAADQFIEMDATVGAMDRGLRFSIVGADGTVVKPMGEAHVRTVVPSTQDYYVELASDVGAVSYQMSVFIPVRIHFAPGETSAEVSGSLAAGDARHYVFRALAGQRVLVEPRATQGQVQLIMWGADGQVLLSGHAGPPSSAFDGVLPTTQDYLIGVRAGGETGADYTLEVTIPPP